MWVSISPVLWLLWQGRRSIWRFAVWGLLASIVLALVIPKRYESTTRLMPPDSRPSAGMAVLASLPAGSSGLGGFASSLLGMQSSGALFIGILSGRTVQERLVDRFDLRRRYGVARVEDACEILAQHTRLSDDRSNGIVKITVSDRDPSTAAAMADAYVQELDHLVVQLSTSDARRERVFLEERLRTVKADLDASSERLSEFSSKNKALDLKEQGRAMVDAAAKLQGELIAAESQLKGLEQIYAVDSVRVRAARARIAELQHQLQKMTAPRQSDASDGNSFYPSIRTLPGLGMTYAGLYREVQIEEAVYETLTKEYELAKVREAKEIPTVRVLDAARVPEKKSFPPRQPIVIFGTLFACVMGCAWILGKELWQRSDNRSPLKLLVRGINDDWRSRNPSTRKTHVPPTTSGNGS